MPEIRMTDQMVREFMRNHGFVGELAAEVMARREQLGTLSKTKHWCQCADCQSRMRELRPINSA